MSRATRNFSGTKGFSFLESLIVMLTIVLLATVVIGALKFKEAPEKETPSPLPEASNGPLSKSETTERSTPDSVGR